MEHAMDLVLDVDHASMLHGVALDRA